jgi:hypothetical protein
VFDHCYADISDYYFITLPNRAFEATCLTLSDSGSCNSEKYGHGKRGNSVEPANFYFRKAELEYCYIYMYVFMQILLYDVPLVIIVTSFDPCISYTLCVT